MILEHFLETQPQTIILKPGDRFKAYVFHGNKNKNPFYIVNNPFFPGKKIVVMQTMGFCDMPPILYCQMSEGNYWVELLSVQESRKRPFLKCRALKVYSEDEKTFEKMDRENLREPKEYKKGDRRIVIVHSVHIRRDNSVRGFFWDPVIDQDREVTGAVHFDNVSYSNAKRYIGKEIVVDVFGERRGEGLVHTTFINQLQIT